jgi:membrane fusion protein
MRTYRTTRKHRSSASMTEPATLFRPSAIAANRADAYGRITLVAPPSLRVLSILALVATAAVLALLVAGSYARHTTLIGQLVPDRGLIGVVSAQRGVIIDRRVMEGDSVDAGDVLYVLSAERFSREAPGAHARLAGTLEMRHASLADQIESLAHLEELELSGLASRRDEVAAELGALARLRETQHEIAALANDAAERAAWLYAQRFVSVEEVDGKTSLALEQRARLQALEREQKLLEREQDAVVRELALLPLRYRREYGELARALLANQLEQIENDTRGQSLVVAPAAGIVAALMAEAGQVADSGAVLARIVPDGAHLEAHLLAAPHAIGAIAAGDVVQLRYPAFPYQSFGHYRGRVARVSLSTLPAASGVESFYRVVVALDKQDVVSRGRAHALQPGMSVEADVLHERRSLIGWIIDPLQSLTERWH